MLAGFARRGVQAVLARSNRFAVLRFAKRRLGGMAFSVHGLDSITTLDCWQQDGWVREPQSSWLRTCLASEPPSVVCVVASARRWCLGQGYVSRMWEHLGVPGWWLGGVWVQPLARGMGLGERLVALAESQAAAIGVREVRTNVATSNHAAVALYGKRGFVFDDCPEWRRAIEAHYEAVGSPEPQTVLRKDLAAG